jgi:hypothetical protein
MSVFNIGGFFSNKGNPSLCFTLMKEEPRKPACTINGEAISIEEKVGLERAVMSIKKLAQLNLL